MTAGAWPGRRAARWAFVVYALTLFVLTHWPRLAIPIPGRPDLLVHAAVFGAWAVMMAACRWFGPAASGRNLALTAVIGVAYAAVDEALQAIPFLHRHAALDDWAANALGVALGVLAVAGAGGWRRGSASGTSHEAEPIGTIAGGAGLGGAIRVVSGLTLLSRIGGLARDATTVRVFGATAIGSAFNAAFAVPNMFRRLLGEGALAAAFLPEYTRAVEEDRQRADRVASLTIWMLTAVTVSIVVAIELALWATLALTPERADRDESLRLIMLMLPYMPMVCVGAILSAMLQVHGRFGPPAAMPLILNAAMILAALWFFMGDLSDPERSRTAERIGVAVLASGVVQIAWSLHALRRHVSWTRRFEGAGAPVRAMLRRFVPVLIGMGTLQFNTMIDTVIAMWPIWFGPTVLGIAYPLDAASNSILAYTQRLYQFPLGVFGLAVATAAFPMLARDAASPDRFASTLRRGIRLSLFIGVPAAIGLMLVRRDLIAVAFSGGGRGFTPADVDRASGVLLAYALAVWAYSMNHVLARAFYAQNDTATPTRIALWCMALNIALNAVLIWPLAEAGMALATALSACVQAVWLSAATRRRLGVAVLDAPTRRAVFRIVLATGVMAGAVAALTALRDDRQGWLRDALWLTIATGTGAAAYAAACSALRVPELRWILDRSRASG